MQAEKFTDLLFRGKMNVGGICFQICELVARFFGTLERVFARPCGVLKKKRISGYIQLWTVNDVHAVHK